MKIATSAIAIALLAAAATPISAVAATGLYANEATAAQSCAADEVVWVDVDHGRFYHKAQASFGKGGNGGFTCLKVAHAQYREGHDS